MHRFSDIEAVSLFGNLFRNFIYSGLNDDKILKITMSKLSDNTKKTFLCKNIFSAHSSENYIKFYKSRAIKSHSVN
jgi:hypothetical protein